MLPENPFCCMASSLSWSSLLLNFTLAPLLLLCLQVHVNRLFFHSSLFLAPKALTFCFQTSVLSSLYFFTTPKPVIILHNSSIHVNSIFNTLRSSIEEKVKEHQRPSFTSTYVYPGLWQLWNLVLLSAFSTSLSLLLSETMSVL